MGSRIEAGPKTTFLTRDSKASKLVGSRSQKTSLRCKRSVCARQRVLAPPKITANDLRRARSLQAPSPGTKPALPS